MPSLLGQLGIGFVIKGGMNMRLEANEFYINETCGDGYCPFDILLDETGYLNEIADEQQKAKGKIPLFDNSGEYDGNDWYNFFLECNENGVSRLYYEYGLSGEFGDDIEIDEVTKQNAFSKVLAYFGGLDKYKEYIKEWEG